jgi:hypothetical protein
MRPPRVYVIILILIVYIISISNVWTIQRYRTRNQISHGCGIFEQTHLFRRRKEYAWDGTDIGELPEKLIWMYWEGDPLEWVSLMLDIARKNSGYRVVMLTPDTVNDYISAEEIHPEWKRIRPIAHKADYLRCVLLLKYGGVWMDVDTIIFSDLSELFELLKTYGMVGFDDMGFNPNLGVMVSRKGNPILKLWKREMEREMPKEKSWTDNIHSLNRICFDFIVRDGFPYRSFDEAPTYVVPYNRDKEWFQPGNFKSIRRTNQPFVTFSGGGKRTHLNHLSRHELLHSDMLWSSTVQHALAT